jgi:hypothetical protein
MENCSTFIFHSSCCCIRIAANFLKNIILTKDLPVTFQGRYSWADEFRKQFYVDERTYTLRHIEHILYSFLGAVNFISFMHKKLSGVPFLIVNCNTGKVGEVRIVCEVYSGIPRWNLCGRLSILEDFSSRMVPIESCCSSGGLLLV